ncbi:MAG: ribonuclease HII [Candidatus Omnitrophota bacterium]
MLYYERRFKRLGYKFIIGVDEAGRGPLAGPVVAAAVLLKKHTFRNIINDSKALTPLARDKAFTEIKKHSLIGIGIVGEKVIDRINILQATHLAIQKAVRSLIRKLSKVKLGKAYIIVDGNMPLSLPLPYLSIIRGDAKSKSIAAASIIAKVTRDRIMLAYDRIYPEYGFKAHKGYPTKEHKESLKRLGPLPIHRRSFLDG